MPEKHPLAGRLQQTSSGALVLRVPAALVRGYYLSISRPGVRMPDRGDIGCVRVCSPAEFSQLSKERRPRRNQLIHYALGKLEAVQTRRPGITRIWYVPISSKDLQDIRRYCGLPERKFRLIIGYSVSRAPKEAADEDPAVPSATGLSHSAEVSGEIGEAAQITSDFARSGRGFAPIVAREVEAPSFFLLRKTGALKELQKARAQTETNPTEAQAAAGNYAKGKLRLHGLDISLENPKGSTRSGTDANGKSWSVTLAHDYGYIRRTEGADGDHVDVFIGPNPECELVFIVNQVDPATRKFDEHKVMLGFCSKEAARKGYLANYEKGWKGLGSIKPMTLPDFKVWLESTDSTRKKATEICPCTN